MIKIGVFDSGLGGLNLLGALNEQMTDVAFYYYGDNANAPYGSSQINRISTLVGESVLQLTANAVDAIVVGCNTVSTTLLSKIKRRVSIPVFGVFPPVERCLVMKEKTLLLCTERTAQIYKNYSDLSICVLTGVVDEIENFYNDIYHCKLLKTKNRPLFLQSTLLDTLLEGKKGVYDSVIFGCTHYFFQKIGILDHLAPKKYLDGVDFTAKYVSNYFNNKNHKKKSNENQFYFLGDFAYLNKSVFFDVVMCGKKAKKITK